MLQPLHPIAGRKTVLGLAAASALAVIVALAIPNSAVAQEAAQPAPQAMPGHMHGQAHGRQDAVEARIAELHKNLQITPEEESQWNAVAQTMRDNQKAGADLIREKRQNEASLTAVDDLRAYADIAENHAAGVRKLADAFVTLYAAMPDAQKKVADEVFRQHKRRSMRHH